MRLLRGMQMERDLQEGDEMMTYYPTIPVVLKDGTIWE